MDVEGYQEEGSTTTPFDMMLRNKVSRFDVAKWALKRGAELNPEVKKELESLLKEVDERVKDVRQFIADEGKGKSLLFPGEREVERQEC